MDLHKSLDIDIKTVMKNPETLEFLIILKLKNV